MQGFGKENIAQDDGKQEREKDSGDSHREQRRGGVSRKNENQREAGATARGTVGGEVG